MIIHDEDKKKEKCSYCQKSFSPVYLKAHIMFTHEGIRNHQCELCGKEFLLLNQFKKHMEVH